MKSKSTATKLNEAKLIPGSLYQKENADFIDQTMAAAQDLFRSLSQDPVLKKSSLRKKAKKIYANLLTLDVEIRYRRENMIERMKKQNAAEEDYWLFDDEKHLECMAVESISQEDLIHAYSLWPKFEVIRS